MESHSDASPTCLLVLAQVDHVSGDIIATVVEHICHLGARNVHLVPSLTKKGRPGYLLFLDVPEGILEDVSTALATELGVLGVRVLSSEHRPFPFVSEVQTVTIDLGGKDVRADVPVKRINTRRGPVPTSVEHDFCVRLQRDLREEQGVEVPLHVLKASILAAVNAAVEDFQGERASNDPAVNPEKERKD